MTFKKRNLAPHSLASSMDHSVYLLLLSLAHLRVYCHVFCFVLFMTKKIIIITMIIIFILNSWESFIKKGLKPLDPFSKQCCPRPTLCVPQLLYQITNLWKFRLNRSSESGENNRKTHPCFRAFRRVMTFKVNPLLSISRIYIVLLFSKKVKWNWVWNWVQKHKCLPE